jgi:hypothetical protein
MGAILIKLRKCVQESDQNCFEREWKEGNEMEMTFKVISFLRKDVSGSGAHRV